MLVKYASSGATLNLASAAEAASKKVVSLTAAYILVSMPVVLGLALLTAHGLLSLTHSYSVNFLPEFTVVEARVETDSNQSPGEQVKGRPINYSSFTGLEEDT